jgi:hypothetical protein
MCLFCHDYGSRLASDSHISGIQYYECPFCSDPIGYKSKNWDETGIRNPALFAMLDAGRFPYLTSTQLAAAISLKEEWNKNNINWNDPS